MAKYKFTDDCPTSERTVKNPAGIFVKEKFKAVRAFGNIVDEAKLNTSEDLVAYLMSKEETAKYIQEVKTK